MLGGLFGGKKAAKAADAPLCEVSRILAAKHEFDVLDIPITPANPAVVKKLYRKLALKIHPDKCKHERAEEAFKILTAAHERLSDEREQRIALADARAFGARDAAEVIRQRKASAEEDRRAESRRAEVEAMARLAQKRADDEARKQHKRDENDKKADAEARKKEDAAIAARLESEQQQRLRDERKRDRKALQRAKRRLRQAVAALREALEEFGDDSGALAQLLSDSEVERLCDLCDETERCERATALALSGSAEALAELREILTTVVTSVDEKAAVADQERLVKVEAARAASEAAAAQRALDALWGEKEVELLVKAARKQGAPAPASLAKAGVAHALPALPWAAIADHLNTAAANSDLRSADECRAKYKELVKLQREKQQQHLQQRHQRQQNASHPAPASVKTNADAPPPPPSADARADADADAWTVAQQLALETALARHPKTLDAKTRWRSIADDVGGKTAKQCVARFKALATRVRGERDKHEAGADRA